MMDSQKFCLKWNNFQNSVTSVFENLRQDEELVDITLCCEGHKIKAHRMMLSACSPYFRDLLKENPCQHPVFFLKDTSYPDLAAVVEFVYKGEVNVAQSQLGSFLKTAEMLQVRGLTGDEDEEAPPTPAHPWQQQKSPAPPRPPARPAVSSALQQQLNSSVGGRPRPSSPPNKRRRVSSSPERPTPRQDYIKVEKVDLADEDDESLEATFSQVSSFEAAQFEGSDQSTGSHDMAGLLSRVSEQGIGDMSAMAGPSEDGASQGYGCPVCGRCFNSQQGIRRHELVHQGRTVCPVCGRAFSRSDSLRRHLHMIHGGAGAPGPPLTCEYCGKVYHHVNSLSDHRTLHRGLTTCGICGKVYSTKSTLTAHVRRVHKRTGVRRAAPAPAAARLTCELCGKVLRSEASLSNHRSIHRGSTRCHLCGGVYSTISALRRHRSAPRLDLAGPRGLRLDLRGPRPGPPGSRRASSEHRCAQCGRHFASEASLGNHRSVHRGITRCGVCGRVYSTTSVLHRHSFLSRAGLSRHKAVHRGETGCPVCGRVFSNKYNLNVHIAAKHRPGGGGTPRVLCTTCGKTFSSSTSLANHKPLHAGHTTCRLCAKVYATRHNLRVHMRRDHGVEPGGGEPGGMPPHWAGPGSL
ncbi:zinc finger protein 534-like [Pollicipes pollicipes]|uniref:zinc finger protein 534-like n=1 Tax=Pollicipes pollicipes TaxID=41117 RepID=UPI0018852EBC|nr:zinc finger protein 534-like [Pollicipes pollicipes]